MACCLHKRIYKSRVEAERKYCCGSCGTVFLPRETQKLVEQLIRQHFKGDKTKINAKAVAAVCELLRLFVAETVQRASDVASANESSEIDVPDVEKVLAQIFLDF